jgi:hypothetical protein
MIFSEICSRVVRCLILLSIGGMPFVLVAQDSPVPLHSPSDYLYTRMSLIGDNVAGTFPEIRPLWRGDLFNQLYNTFGADSIAGSSVLSEFDLSYLLADHDEYFLFLSKGCRKSPLFASPPVSKRPFLGVFYRRPAHLFALDDTAFFLRVNPVIDFGFGNESGLDDPLFINRRGIEIRGGIDRKVFFSSNIIEAQLRPPAHVRQFVERFRALPDAGLWKSYQRGFLSGDGAYDYLSSSGYVGFRLTRHIGLQLGHGKHFLGDGYRSLFLSDFTKNYFYLKFNTRIWRFHYQNIFAELAAREKEAGNVVVPKKYMAAHYLGFRVTDRFSIGLFESVIFAREENRFELQYLNPVIFYRSIEHHVGSPDNVVLGVSARWDLFNTVRLYGQLVLDEFRADEFFSDRHWWGNKFGFQGGVWYVNALGVRDLDVRLEYNRVRPFTYSHYDSLGSYAHFNQPLAHPFGANFSEVLFVADYRPVPRLWITGKMFYTDAGADTEDVYYGANILRPNTGRNAEYGVTQNQGVGVSNVIFSLTAAYMFRHNLFVDVQYFHRDFDSEPASDDLLTRYVALGLRWNFFRTHDEF